MAVADARSAVPAAQPFEHLVLDFLAYLEFERGLSRNTLEAYRSDLLQYGAWLNRTGVGALDAGHAELAAFTAELATGGLSPSPVASTSTNAARSECVTASGSRPARCAPYWSRSER